jgi:hypothetical protein
MIRQPLDLQVHFPIHSRAQEEINLVQHQMELMNPVEKAMKDGFVLNVSSGTIHGLKIALDVRLSGILF